MGISALPTHNGKGASNVASEYPAMARSSTKRGKAGDRPFAVQAPATMLSRTCRYLWPWSATCFARVCSTSSAPRDARPRSLPPAGPPPLPVLARRYVERELAELG